MQGGEKFLNAILRDMCATWELTSSGAHARTPGQKAANLPLLVARTRGAGRWVWQRDEATKRRDEANHATKLNHAGWGSSGGARGGRSVERGGVHLQLRARPTSSDDHRSDRIHIRFLPRAKGKGGVRVWRCDEADHHVQRSSSSGAKCGAYAAGARTCASAEAPPRAVGRPLARDHAHLLREERVGGGGATEPDAWYDEAGAWRKY